jgi:uncharacterized protein YbjQ (UPF0145 family)
MSDQPPPGYEDADDPGGGPALGEYTGELPPEAAQRLERGPWGSGLSVNDFAACAQVGLRPVALVQGFCVMQWSWYGAGSPYMSYGGGGWGPGRGMGGPFGIGGVGGPGRPTGTIGGGPFGAGGGFGGGGRSAYGRSRWGTTLSSYNCPHGYASMEHRYWGENFEQRWKSQAWANGFNTACERMIAEARDAGAEGVIGVVDTVSSLIDRRIREFHIYGTAVVVDDDRSTGGADTGARARGNGGAAGPGAKRPIWTTYLAGQRLLKLFESGFVPTSVVASMASVRIWAVCVTEMLMRGAMQMGMGYGTYEISQISDAQMQVRDLARDHVRSTLGPDMLQGADLDVGWHDVGEGDYEVEAVLRGTRAHRFRRADPLAPPELTVRMT